MSFQGDKRAEMSRTAFKSKYLQIGKLATGNILDISHVAATFYNMDNPSAEESYSIDQIEIGGKASTLINCANEPTVTGAVKIIGSTFLPNVDMYLKVRYYGITPEYYFEQFLEHDADAQKLINQLSAPNADLQADLHRFFIDTKAISDGAFYNKIHALHLHCGSTAADHKWNAVNPVDTDAAFRGTFFGGMTHDKYGSKGNGTNGYMDTHLTPSLHLTENSTSILYATDSAYSEATFEIGVDGGSGLSNNPRLMLAVNYPFSGDKIITDQYAFSTARINELNTGDGTGVYISARTQSNIFKVYAKGLQVGPTQTGAPLSGGATFADINDSITVNAIKRLDNGSTYSHSTKRCQTSAVMDGVTDTEALEFSNILNTFNANRINH